jgi:hypothetical protein
MPTMKFHKKLLHNWHSSSTVKLRPFLGFEVATLATGEVKGITTSNGATLGLPTPAIQTTKVPT